MSCATHFWSNKQTEHPLNIEQQQRLHTLTYPWDCRENSKTIFWRKYIVSVPAKPKNSSTKESAIKTLILCLTVIKTQLSSVEYIKSSISHNWHYSLQNKNEQIGLVPSKHIYLFCLCLLFSTEPYFFKIDDHISMLLSLFVHNSLEGLDLLIELSNLWPTTVKSAHA